MKKLNKINIINFVSIFLIVVFIVEITIFRSILLYVQELYLPYLDLTHIWIFIIRIIHLTIAVWLFIDAKSKKQLPFVWAFLSLSFGLIALFTYYWRLIYLKTNQNQN